MQKYMVEVTETLQKQLTVEAESKLDAYLIAKQMYKNSEIVLYDSNHVDTKIAICEQINIRNKKVRER